MARFAIVLSYLIIASFVVAIGVRDQCLDTVSAMVARRPSNVDAFAVGMAVVVGLHVYWVRAVMHRRECTRVMYFGFACSLVGAIGFAGISTARSKATHWAFAALAFAGMLVYLWTMHSGDCPPLRVAAVCLVALAAGGPYWLEYILITALHVAAYLHTPPAPVLTGAVHAAPPSPLALRL